MSLVCVLRLARSPGTLSRQANFPGAIRGRVFLAHSGGADTRRVFPASFLGAFTRRVRVPKIRFGGTSRKRVSQVRMPVAAQCDPKSPSEL